jgi:hypothetical protein
MLVMSISCNPFVSSGIAQGDEPMYTLNYDTITGKVCSIQKGNMSIPICEENMDFQDFLKWNAEQAVPLDLNSTITPTPPQPPQSMHVAALMAVNVTAKKATVVRKYLGQNYTTSNCYVSLQALEAYQAGKLKLYNPAYGINSTQNADSFVLVYFISETPFDTELAIPVIIDKIVR